MLDNCLFPDLHCNLPPVLLNLCPFTWTAVHVHAQLTYMLGVKVSHSVVSDSLWPYGLYSPWNSPGQNTGHSVFPFREWEPFASPGDLPNPGIKPRSPTLQMDSLPAEPLEKPHFLTHLHTRSIWLQILMSIIQAPVVLYGCESWNIKKDQHQRIDAFKLWCWRKLFRVCWTARRSNQSS